MATAIHYSVQLKCSFPRGKRKSTYFCRYLSRFAAIVILLFLSSLDISMIRYPLQGSPYNMAPSGIDKSVIQTDCHINRSFLVKKVLFGTKTVILSNCHIIRRGVILSGDPSICKIRSSLTLTIARHVASLLRPSHAINNKGQSGISA